MYLLKLNPKVVALLIFVPLFILVFGIKKFLGLVLVLLGIWFLKDFPDLWEYQREYFHTALLVGAILIIIGIVLLVF
jgi:hypothetical protein